MVNSNSFRIVSDEEGVRLDVFLSARLHLTRSRVQDMVGLGCVRANGTIPKPSLRVRRFMVIEGEIPEEEPPELAPEEIPLQVLYEDDYLIAIDKPAGMVVHPSAGHAGGTLVNAILGHLAGEGGIRDSRFGDQGSGVGVESETREADLVKREASIYDLRDTRYEIRSPLLRPGIVHRLDKGTTGVILVAKDATTQELLSRLFKDRAMAKTYRAVVEGSVERDTGLIEGNIGRHPVDRKKMAVLKTKGRTAATSYRVVHRLKGFTYVEAYPATGRTHQIRVHLAHIGHPVVGDETYGRKARTLTPRPLLHAFRLNFEHPRTHHNLALEAPVPRDIEEFLTEYEVQT
jgi:23S rRNA pseudouridine1911/1915/1917 synthase